MANIILARPDTYPEASHVAGLVSSEPEIVKVRLNGRLRYFEPGQCVIPHGPDRELTHREVLPVR